MSVGIATGRPGIGRSQRTTWDCFRGRSDCKQSPPALISRSAPRTTRGPSDDVPGLVSSTPCIADETRKRAERRVSWLDAWFMWRNLSDEPFHVNHLNGLLRFRAVGK